MASLNRAMALFLGFMLVVTLCNLLFQAVR
jgi:hypothetical protein